MSVYRVIQGDKKRETHDREEFEDLVNLLTESDRDFVTEVDE